MNRKNICKMMLGMMILQAGLSTPVIQANGSAVAATAAVAVPWREIGENSLQVAKNLGTCMWNLFPAALRPITAELSVITGIMADASKRLANCPVISAALLALTGYGAYKGYRALIPAGNQRKIEVNINGQNNDE